MRAGLVSTKGLFLKQGSFISFTNFWMLLLPHGNFGLFDQIEMGGNSNRRGGSLPHGVL